MIPMIIFASLFFAVVAFLLFAAVSAYFVGRDRRKNVQDCVEWSEFVTKRDEVFSEAQACRTSSEAQS